MVLRVVVVEVVVEAGIPARNRGRRRRGYEMAKVAEERGYQMDSSPELRISTMSVLRLCPKPHGLTP